MTEDRAKDCAIVVYGEVVIDGHRIIGRPAYDPRDACPTCGKVAEEVIRRIAREEARRGIDGLRLARQNDPGVLG